MLFCLKNCSSDIFFDRFLVCQKIAMIPRLFLPILSAALPIKMSWVFQVMSSSPPRVGDLIAWPPPGPLAHALIATLRQSDGAMAFLITFTQNKFFAMYLKGRAKESKHSWCRMTVGSWWFITTWHSADGGWIFMIIRDRHQPGWNYQNQCCLKILRCPVHIFHDYRKATLEPEPLEGNYFSFTAPMDVPLVPVAPN